LKYNTPLNSIGAIISKFDYGYSAPGRIGDWTQQQGAQTPVKTSFGYDDVDQLRDATARDTATQAVLKRYAYHYDPAGNRTTEQVDNMVATEIPNDLNQLTSRTAGGAMKVQGALTEPARVTINGVPARVDANNQFEGSASVTSGANQFEVAATDGNGNTATQRYQVNVPAASAVTQEYDFNGNLTRKIEAGSPMTYEWDAANRLIAINNGTGRSEFEYDGLSRRVHIVEKESGVVTSDRRFVWSGLTLAEERDTTDTNATKRFFSQGAQTVGGANTGNYYYAKDHLGSIRELTDASSAVRARYDYDPYGRSFKSGGDLDADFGFTGHYVHQRSGMNLAPYRSYDPNSAKWLSRDPLAEAGGLNLYGYVGNNPVVRVDPLGLAFGDYWDIRATSAFYTTVGNTTTNPWAGAAAAVANSLISFFGADVAQSSGETLGDDCSSTRNKVLAAGVLGLAMLPGFGEESGAARLMTAEKQALIDMAKADSKRILRGLGPVSAADADAY
jgi:RHS repeat-associated protein